MDQYIGLDVSLRDTVISVREGGKRIWRGKCASDPAVIARVIRTHAPSVRRVVFETGPLSVRFFHTLMAQDVPVMCIDARHAKAALDMAPNKTDVNGADGLAHLAEIGFYREVRVKNFDAMLVRTLLAARHQMLKMAVQISNQIRGAMNTFGQIVSKSAGSVSEGHIRPLPATNAGLERIVLPLLETWLAVRARTAQLSKQLIASACADEQCQLLTSTPGIGVVTASSFIAANEDSANFAKSRPVGAWIGLTTKRYQSSEVD